MIGTLLRARLNTWSRISGEIRPTTPPDLAAMAIAIDPSIAELTPYYVVVETAGTHTRGMTLADWRRYSFTGELHEPNVTVTTAIDNDRYRDLVLSTLLTIPGDG